MSLTAVSYTHLTDIRGGDFFEDFFQELDYMKSKEVKYKILFLDASDTVLILSLIHI